MDLKSLGIICAKANSTGFPGKNMALLNAKPLIWQTFSAALNSQLSKIVLSTDSPEIADYGRKCNMNVPYISNWKSSRNKIRWDLRQALDWAEEEDGLYDAVVLLQPTSPFRTSKDIDICLALLYSTESDSVISVVEVTKQHPKRCYSLNNETGLLSRYEQGDEVIIRQDFKKIYAQNGAVYAVKRDTLVYENSLYGDIIYPYIMPTERSIDIDSELDLAFAQFIGTKLNLFGEVSTTPPD